MSDEIHNQLFRLATYLEKTPPDLARRFSDEVLSLSAQILRGVARQTSKEYVLCSQGVDWLIGREDAPILVRDGDTILPKIAIAHACLEGVMSPADMLPLQRIHPGKNIRRQPAGLVRKNLKTVREWLTVRGLRDLAAELAPPRMSVNNVFVKYEPDVHSPKIRIN